MSDFESRLRAALEDETTKLSAPPELADDMITIGGRVRRRRRVVGGVAFVAVLALALPVWHTVDSSSNSVPPSHRPTVTTPVPVTPAPQSTPPPNGTTHPPPADWSTAGVDVVSAPAHPPEVVDLRVGEHAGYDRIVIDLDGALPGYRVQYVPSLHFDASGAAVPLSGTAFIQISLTPANAHDGQGNSVYQGPQVTTFSMPTLRGVAMTGDFEGVVSFGIALSSHAGFRVSTLTSPSRLVIDLQHQRP